MECVNDYIDEYSEVRKAPLKFHKYNSKVLEIKQKDKKIIDNLDSLVIWILDTSNYCKSFNVMSGKTETYCGKWRSSFDIWRHCKYYNEDISLENVMASLFRIQSLLVGHYCCTVDRRVFKLKKNVDDYGLINYERDEFGLHFRDWKNIDKEY